MRAHAIFDSDLTPSATPNTLTTQPDNTPACRVVVGGERGGGGVRDTRAPRARARPRGWNPACAPGLRRPGPISAFGLFKPFRRVLARSCSLGPSGLRLSPRTPWGGEGERAPAARGWR